MNKETEEKLFFASNQPLIHIRYQQRNGRKSLTTIEGLNHYLDEHQTEKLLRAFKKEFCCNGQIGR